MEPKKWENIKPIMVEQFTLGADETIEDFQRRLIEALKVHVRDVMKHDGSWMCEAIGDGWCVCLCATYGDGVTIERFKIEWRQVGEEIEFGKTAKVKRRVVYDPDKHGATHEPAHEPEQVALTAEQKDALLSIATRAAMSDPIFDVARECPRMRHDELTAESAPGTRFRFDGLRDTFLLESVRVIERREDQTQEVAPFEITDADFVSPSGEKYIAVLVGCGAMDSVINLNHRLYDAEGEQGQPGMRQNIESQQKMITTAFRDRVASMGSELDHPDDGQTFKSLATELIDVRRDGVRVAIKEGVLATTEGLNLKVAAAHGFPLGKSTLSRGVGERRVMNADNPLFKLNTDHDGEVYDHIIGFEIYQYDTVRDPSARVYVQAKRAEMSREVREACEALLCDDGTCPIDGACADGSTPKPAQSFVVEAVAIRNAESLKEIEMDETQVKQLIAEAVAQAASANDELKALVEQLSSKQTATEAALVEAQAVNTKLVDELRDARTVLDVAREQIAKISAERDAIALEKTIRDAVKTHCASKTDEIEPIRAKRENYILDMSDRFVPPAKAEELAAAIEAHVKTCSERFDKVVGPDLKELHEAANRRPIAAAHVEARYERGDGFANDPIPVAMSVIENRS